MRLIKDSGGIPSWSYTLGIPSVIAITIWFILGGIDVSVGDVHITTATKDGLQYAAGITPWLAYLRSRSWVPGGTGKEEVK